MEWITRMILTLTVAIRWCTHPIHVFLSFNARRRSLLPAQKNSQILNLPAELLAKKIRTKEISCVTVVKAFVERCRDVNPLLNAVVEERYLAALDEAERVDILLSSGEKTEFQLETDTPLLGVPITVKEACSMAGMSYSTGSILRAGIKAETDGCAVANLRKAGAIPIAVTNTPELCTSLETNNIVTGFTRNPYDRNRTSGGSSGGEAALISAGASVLGVGSDFAGSIRVPCLFTGIFGHKPTPGVVPNKGHCPDLDDKEFQKLLTTGPICRYAQDLKLALATMAGENARLLHLEQKVDLKDVKIYYYDGTGFKVSEVSVDKNIRNCIKNSAKYFEKQLGCSAQKLRLEEMEYLLEMCIMQTTDIENLPSILNLKKDGEESGVWIEFLKVATHMSDYTLSMMIVKFILKTRVFIPRYKRFKYTNMRNNMRKNLMDLLGENGVIFFPTFATSAFLKNQMLGYVSSFGYPMMANILGFPATHVPIGLNKQKLPFGFQVIAAPYNDRLCLAVAEELERIYGGWIPPKMEST